MKLKAATWQFLHQPKRLTSVVMMLIIWAGVAGSLFAVIVTDTSEKTYLRNRATTIAATIPFDKLKALEGNQTDTNTEEYRELKASLQRIMSKNQDLSYIRLVGRDVQQPFYYVDSEQEHGRYATTPGLPSLESGSHLTAAFINEDATVESLRQDQWGAWVTAYAPIIDPAANRIYAIVTVHTPALNYYFRIFIYALVPLLLAAIPLVGLVRDRKLESKEREISGLKNQFVSIASHELRSPLTGILWAIQSMLSNKKKKLTKSQEVLLSDMYHSAQASLATVNEILDLSIFERGQAAKLQHEAVDMTTVMKEVSKTLKLGADEKKIKIVFAGEWPPHAFVSGDVGALKRAFMNIISNAVKYSPNNSQVELRYKYRSMHHHIIVKDHGIGIPKKEQVKVLEGYYRASNAVKIQAHGTGLGLWITRMVIEQHDGEIELRSKVGSGTELEVSLPAYHQVIAAPKNED